MFEVIESDVFGRWMDGLKDQMAKNQINIRIRRAAAGNFGDWKSVGDGVSELRIDHGAGYRVYFTRRSSRIIVVLAGGTKRTQPADIAKAIEIAKQYG